jgi:hypothetical protein
MKKEQRIILRTETFERITLRQSSKIINRETLALGIYKIEICKVEPEKEQIIFAAEIIGLIEIVETDEEIRLVYPKN